MAVAATRADLAIVKTDVEDIKETARLIEGRLVRLESTPGSRRHGVLGDCPAADAGYFRTGTQA